MSLHNTGCVEATVGGWALLHDLRAEGRDIGTVSQAVELFAGIREMICRRSLPPATRHLRIVPSQLDQRASLIGLTYLLSDWMFEPALVEKMLLPPTG